MTDPIERARNYLEEIMTVASNKPANDRTIAAAALLIREGLDKLARAERRSGKTGRMSTAIREALKDE